MDSKGPKTLNTCYRMGDIMKSLEALKSLSKGIKRKDFKPHQGGLLWIMFQSLVGAYQKENSIMFLILPDNDRASICEWIDQLT